MTSQLAINHAQLLRFASCELDTAQTMASHLHMAPTESKLVARIKTVRAALTDCKRLATQAAQNADFTIRAKTLIDAALDLELAVDMAIEHPTQTRKARTVEASLSL